MIQEQSPLLFSSKTQPPNYGFVEINEPSNARRKKLRLGLASISIIAVVAVSFAVILVTSFNSVQYEEPLAILKAAANNDQLNIDHKTSKGSLRGYIRTSRKGRSYTAFYKVPFAKPPLGDLRFKDPEPSEPWQGLRDFKEGTPQCIQKARFSPIIAVGEEDCLYMNIFTPKVPQNNAVVNYPTLVFIHGGDFTDGNGSRYGAEYFMDEDAVLITFDFRLGPFGFLNTGDDVIRGNMGFKDQVMVLRWVKDNIVDYGGDPSRVTIIGSSSGAYGVSLHLISPLSNGLFHRAIAQSGSAICGVISYDPSPSVTVSEVAKVVNCTVENGSQELLECLKTKEAKDIALIRTPNSKYALTIEDTGTNPEKAFMPDKPYTLLKSGKINPVPYIIGVNSAEAIGQGLGILFNPESVDKVNSNFSLYIRDVLHVDLSDKQLEEIREFYFGDKEIGNSTLTEFINLCSDRALVHCSKVTAEFHGNVTDSYLYYLSKPPALSYAEKEAPGFPAGELGLVDHADELQFLFPYAGYPEIPNGDQEYFHFSEYLVKLWVNFGATGKPSMDGKDWKTINDQLTGGNKEVFWFELNDSPGQTTILQKRMELWDQYTHQQLKYDN